MTIIEAAEALKRGELVRRQAWEATKIMMPVLGGFAVLATVGHEIFNRPLLTEDLLATDWQIHVPRP